MRDRRIAECGLAFSPGQNYTGHAAICIGDAVVQFRSIEVCSVRGIRRSSRKVPPVRENEDSADDAIPAGLRDIETGFFVLKMVLADICL